MAKVKGVTVLESLQEIFDAWTDDELTAKEYENALTALRDSDNSDDDERKQAALMLAVDSSEIPEQSTYDDCVFECDGDDYRVLTDDEADEACKDYVKGSLWAFNADFIISECGLDSSLAEMLQSFQSDKCEGANDAIESLITATCGINEFVDSAIKADGRGHFLNREDGDELESGDYYIYRS